MHATIRLSTLLCVLWLAVSVPAGAGDSTSASDGAANPDLQRKLGASDNWKVDDTSTLVLTQELEDRFPLDHPLRVRWALDLRDRRAIRMWLPEPVLELPYYLIETEKHDLIAVETHTGIVRWWTRFPAKITGNVFFGEAQVYANCRGRLACLERYSGDLIWNVQLPFPPAAGPTVVETRGTEPVIYMPGLDGVLYSIDVHMDIWPPAEGLGTLSRKDYTMKRYYPRVLWRYHSHGVISDEVTLSGRHLFAGSFNQRIYGINLREIRQGKPQKMWTHRTSGPNTARVNARGAAVYAPSQDQTLYCLSHRDGGVIWRYIAQDLLHEPVQFVDDQQLEKLYVFLKVGQNGPLACLDNADGRLFWEYPDGIRIVGLFRDEAQMPRDQTVVYVVNEDGSLGALRVSGKDPRSEKQKQEDKLRGTPRPPQEAWRVPMDAFAPFMANNRLPFVFTATENGRIVCALEARK